MFTEGNAFHKLHVFALWRSLTIIVHISAALALIRHNYIYIYIPPDRRDRVSQTLVLYLDYVSRG